VTATFEINGAVKKISGSAVSYFDSIQDAYDAASNGDSIQIQETTLYEPTINFNVPDRQVNVQGGYDPEFSSQNGLTTVFGQLIISNGTAILENLVLQ
ncbi:MAG: hypothetical protein WA610_08260, partial [Thermodesulfovibrionales bacterium]